jgi:hypothetical protein
MHSGFRYRGALFRSACALALVASARPAPAAPAPDAWTPHLLAVDYVSKLPPGSIPTPTRCTMANMNQPRSKTGAIHLHGGVYEPIDATSTNALLGAHRAAPGRTGAVRRPDRLDLHTKSEYGHRAAALRG